MYKRQVLYWFHPLVWVAAFASARDCECACDECATKALSPQERIDYAQTIVRLSGRASKYVSFASAMRTDFRATKTRVARLVRQMCIRDSSNGYYTTFALHFQRLQQELNSRSIIKFFPLLLAMGAKIAVCRAHALRNNGCTANRARQPLPVSHLHGAIAPQLVV